MTTKERRQKAVEAREKIIDEIENKYLGDSVDYIPEDKYFYMLYYGMTCSDALKYKNAKLYIINDREFA